jgi:hypothetical protein
MKLSISPAFLSKTTSVPLEVEKNESAQRAPNPRGASQDHAASRSADRPLCRTQRGTTDGLEERVKTLEAEIDSLLREKKAIEVGGGRLGCIGLANRPLV